ncbi:uncharacterized protein LOC142167344 [Nicotiana tabacum]|uniref:Uncharacterized protein LOC142167344 n=1 Tax=Nicotiana tabacum TaxID=4097 RepID=A0AC58SF52_TOBAC
MADMNSKTSNTNATVPCKSDKAENPKNTDQMVKASEIQSWANVVGGNKLASRGMDLQYIVPMIKDGEKIVQSDLEDVEQENEKWNTTLVLYVIGNSLSIGAMERFLNSVGKYSMKPQIYYYNEDYFVIRFANLEERNQVMYTGPHTINNRPIVMKAWTPYLNLHEEVLRTIPLCVKFLNLPLNCWSMKALSKIGSALGNPVYAGDCTTGIVRISYARILIEIDITKPLPRRVKLQDPMGKTIEQEITYD